MNKIRKVLLLSHLPPRDDVVDKLIATELDAQGVCVWKYPMLEKPRSIIMHVKPDVVILPEIRLEYTRDLARQLQDWGVRVVQRRCEMGISAESPMDDELERCLFGNVDWQNYIDLDIVWGEKFADMLVEHNVPREKIRVVGGIGLDPCFIKAPKEPKRTKPRILFCGGFGYADKSPIYAIPEALIGEEINTKMVMDDRARRDSFAEMMKAVIDKFGDRFEYGVRGHPGEKFTYYGNMFGNKIVPIMDRVTPLAILWADMLIHPGSTMAYEAHLMNTPTFNWRNTNLDVMVGAVAPTFHEVDGLLDAINTVELGKSNAIQESIDNLEPYYGQVDGLAHKRIAAEILKLEKYKTSIPNKWPKDEPKYPNKLTYIDIEQHICAGCDNVFFTHSKLNDVKCPYCGIGIVIHRFINKDGKQVEI